MVAGTQSGRSLENAWAFMPVRSIPRQVRRLWIWGAGVPVVSLTCGYLACLAPHRLLRGRIGSFIDVGGDLLRDGPLAALFQVGYAESLFILLLLIALDPIPRRRYGGCIRSFR